ncbi:hypothetical protein EV702DRAFT_1045541 [Suillus placidus]|uniref:CxC2-like cysteine cluster KDZ transposase-associated domain-containing protein n=1 Tax=Suillus placidus TaxID=48579 RepID=A0A9P7D2J8_9AGAM|nr:hypothetical protein EV702DRAFT_1045541 [Suillus placidus]
MARSKVKEVTPHGTMHLVKWHRGHLSHTTSKLLCKEKTASPNDYLRQWKYRTQDYLDIMLQREVPPPDRACCLCGRDGTHECHDCHARPIFCTKCCRTEHALWPFHQISQWNGDFFERTTLSKPRVEIYAGHGGKPCPNHDWEWEDTDDEGLFAAETPGPSKAALSAGVPPEVPEVDYGGEPGVFGDSGSAAASKDHRNTNTTPAGKTRITVVHTSGIHTVSISLTSAMNYYSKLKWITSSVFPHLVPLLKWNSFFHERREPKDRELALFCPACPQPGINVAVPTKDNAPPSLLYTISLVMDGNFKAEHLHLTNLEDEMFYGGKSQVPSSSRHSQGLGPEIRMQQPQSERRKMMFGRRQMNMDYTLCNALAHNTDGLHRALTFYDVNCQYNKYLWRGVDESLHLSIPLGMDIIPGIGLWHIHGHQDKCFGKYASNIIPCTARINSKIMETLQECLDYQMNDYNFMKMIRMGLFLSQKYKEAKQGVQESTEVFEKLNDAADPDMVQRWEAEEIEAQDSQMTDPTAMDVYDVRLRKARSRKEIKIDLLQTSVARTGERCQLGSVTWFAFRITIEEMQIALAIEVRRMGRHLTETQTLEIGQRQVRLQHSIDEFIAEGVRYLGEEYNQDDQIADMNIDFPEDEDDSDNSSNDVQHSGGPRILFRPETAVIPLLSNLGLDRTQLSNLGADQLLGKYQELEKKDLKATSDVAVPNARGQRHFTLPWFWSLDVQGDSVSNDWMNEFNFMVYKAKTWLARISQNGKPVEDGPRCYAIRQAQMY